MATLEVKSDAKKRLLEKFLRGEVARQNWEVPIEPRSAGTTAPLAPDQQMIWMSSQMAGADPVFNEPLTLHYRGIMDYEALERALNEVMRRHEIFRTTFINVDGEIAQAVHFLNYVGM